MTPFEIEQYQEGSTTNMLGYTSTSKDVQTALKFAFKFLEEEQTPVVFEINFKGSTGLLQLTHDFTAYPEEQEVLV